MKNITSKFDNSEGVVGDFFGFPFDIEYPDPPVNTKNRKKGKNKQKEFIPQPSFEERNALVNMFFVECQFESINEIFEDYLSIGKLNLLQANWNRKQFKT